MPTRKSAPTGERSRKFERMLYVFTGSDSITTRAQAHRFLEPYEEKGAQVEHIDAEVCATHVLRDRTLAQSLFLSSEVPEVTLLDTPSEKAEAIEAVLALAPELAESPRSEEHTS